MLAQKDLGECERPVKRKSLAFVQKALSQRAFREALKRSERGRVTLNRTVCIRTNGGQSALKVLRALRDDDETDEGVGNTLGRRHLCSGGGVEIAGAVAATWAGGRSLFVQQLAFIGLVVGLALLTGALTGDLGMSGGGIVMLMLVTGLAAITPRA